MKLLSLSPSTELSTSSQDEKAFSPFATQSFTERALQPPPDTHVSPARERQGSSPRVSYYAVDTMQTPIHYAYYITLSVHHARCTHTRCFHFESYTNKT